MRRLSSRGGTRAAFSLVEVLVALSILVVIGSGVVYFFITARSTHDTTESRMTVLQQGRMLLEYLKRDLRSIHAEKGDFKRQGKSVIFQRCSGTGNSAELDEITYTFNSGDSTVSRSSQRVGGNVFGGKGVVVKVFSVEPQSVTIGQKKTDYFLVTLKLTDEKDNDRNRLTLVDKIAPPGHRHNSVSRWIP